MPRDAFGIAVPPINTEAIPLDTIFASKFNTIISDIYALFNDLNVLEIARLIESLGDLETAIADVQVSATVATAASVTAVAAATAAEATADQLAIDSAATLAAALGYATSAQGWSQASATASNNLFASTAAGLAFPVPVGQAFWVYSLTNPTLLTLYKVDVGPVATLVGTMPTSAAIDARLVVFEGQQVGKTQQRIGLQTTPVTDASSLNAGNYTFGEPAKYDGVVTQFVFWAKANGTVKAQVRALNSPAVFDQTRVQTVDCVVTTAPSLQTFTVNLPISKGQLVGFHTPAGTIPRPAGASEVYWGVNGAADVLTFNDPSEASDFFLGGYFIVEKDTALKSRMEAVEKRAETAIDKADAITSSSTQYIGISSIPVTSALESTSGHYMIAGGFQNSTRMGGKVEWWALKKTEVTFYIGKRVGDNCEIVRTLDTVKTTVAALNSYNVDARLKPGEYLMLTSPRTGWCSYLAGVSANYAGFWYASFGGLSSNIPGGFFTDTFLNLTDTLQLRFTVEVIEDINGFEAELLFDRDSTERYLFKQTAPDPAAPSQLAAAIVAFKAPASRRGIGVRIDWESGQISNVRWGLGTFDGTKYRIIQDFGKAFYPIGAHSLDISKYKVEIGQYLIGQGDVGGWLKSAAVLNDGLDYLVSGTFLDEFTPGASLSNAQAQVRFVYRAIESSAASGTDEHPVNFGNVEYAVCVGQSWERLTYGPQGCDWPTVLGEMTGRNFENLSNGGTAVATLNGYLQSNVSLYGTQYSDVSAPSVAILTMGLNDFITFTVTRADFQAGLTQMVQIVGAKNTIVASEGTAIYGFGGAATFESVAHNAGASYVSRVEYFNELAPTAYNGFHQGVWRSLTTAPHPGVRLNHLMVNNFWRELLKLPNPQSSRQMFYKRNTFTPASITNAFYNDDPDNYDRMRKWKGIRGGHRYQQVIGGYDDLQNGANHTWTQQDSEYQLLKNGGTINFGVYALDEITPDMLPENCTKISVSVSDTSVLIYARDCTIAPATINDPACGARLVGTGSAEITNLTGLFSNGKIALIYYKATGMTIGLPTVTFHGTPGKPVTYPPQLTEPKGAELLTKLDFNGLGAWTAVGSPSAPSNVATYGFPNGVGWFVTFDGSNYYKQALNYVVDTVKDRKMTAIAQVQYFPNVRTNPSDVAPLSISEDTCNFRRVKFMLIDPNGVPVFGSTATVNTLFNARPPAGLAPLYVQADLTLPANATGLSLAVVTDDLASDAVMKLFKVSCKLVE